MSLPLQREDRPPQDVAQKQWEREYSDLLETGTSNELVANLVRRIIALEWRVSQLENPNR